MQRLLTGIAIGVVMTATVLLAVTVVAQDASPLALSAPLLVDCTPNGTRVG
ncbi:MAG: hypothetical protein HC783_15025 [Rhodobacteraceae bacterium]|nr:hypothetical protein [Paracoccaceae bacterium]